MDILVLYVSVYASLHFSIHACEYELTAGDRCVCTRSWISLKLQHSTLHSSLRLWKQRQNTLNPSSLFYNHTVYCMCSIDTMWMYRLQSMNQMFYKERKLQTGLSAYVCVTVMAWEQLGVGVYVQLTLLVKTQGSCHCEPISLTLSAAHFHSVFLNLLFFSVMAVYSSYQHPNQVCLCVVKALAERVIKVNRVTTNTVTNVSLLSPTLL